MLSKQDIFKELGKEINIYPLHINNIKENSINLTISKNAWSLGSASIIEKTPRKFCLAPSGMQKRKYTIFKGGSAIVKAGGKNYLILLPHVTTIVETSEVIGVGNRIGGTLHSKVGVVAQGIGDIGTMLGPNFCGHLMISLHNITDEVISIEVGETFVSLVFYYLNSASKENKNSNISGHVDKLSELGIKIDARTREYLTEDWKCKIDGIRDKLCASDEYKAFRAQLSKNRRSNVLKYFNVRNIALSLVFIVVVVGAGIGANYIDTKAETSVWSDRYWTVISSGIFVPVLLAYRKFFKKGN